MNYEDMVEKAFLALGIDPFGDWIEEVVRRCIEVDQMVKTIKGSDDAALRSTQSVAIITQNYLIENGYFS